MYVIKMVIEIIILLLCGITSIGIVICFNYYIRKDIERRIAQPIVELRTTDFITTDSIPITDGVLMTDTIPVNSIIIVVNS